MPRLVTSTRRPVDDRTGRYDYEQLVAAEVHEYDTVPVTEDLRLGGVHAQKAWTYWFQYLGDRIWKTDFTREVVAGALTMADCTRPVHVLSLGCGHGGLELEIAGRLDDRPHRLVAVDLNQRLFAEAERRAAGRGLNIEWESVDLNFVEIAEEAFDVIYAHASLHHIINLEHVFQQVRKGLKRDGRFVMLEMIGKSELLFWPENLKAAIEVVRHMPARYARSVPDPAQIAASYERRYAGTEGIRQEEIPSLVEHWFQPVKVFTYGAFVRIICTHPVLGQVFDPERPEDRRYLETVFEHDLRLVREGRLRPTEMFGVFTLKAAQA